MYRALTVADSHHWSLPVKVLIAVHPNATRQVSSNRFHSRQETCANRVKTIRISSYMGHIAKEIVGLTCAADRCACIKSRTRNKTAKFASTYDSCGSQTLQNTSYSKSEFCKWVPAWGANWRNRLHIRSA